MPEERFRHLTILHSNDLHGAFLPEKRDGVMTGGVSLLSGYVNRATAEPAKDGRKRILTERSGGKS